MVNMTRSQIFWNVLNVQNEFVLTKNYKVYQSDMALYGIQLSTS